MVDAVASAGASGQTTLASPEAPKLISQRRRALRTFTGNRTAVVGLALILVIVFIAIAAPLLAPHDPLDQSVSSRLDPPTFENPLGLDDKGRDILSRVIYGARIALMVGATKQKDYTTLQSIMVVYALIIVIINLVVDIIYTYVDPRVRFS